MFWFIYDFRTPELGSRAQQWWREWILWKFFVDYFPIRLIKTAELSPDHNYLIGCHPHGVLSFGSYASLCTTATGFNNKFPGIKPFIATLNGQFWWPIRREEAIICGAVASSQRSLDYVLGNGKGNALGVVLGGAEELLDTHPNNFHLNLLNRRGFIRVALRNGAFLVPLYNFGENATYSQVFPNRHGSFNRRFQTVVRRMWGFCPPLINGRGIFNERYGLMPRKTPINTVVGKPIPVEKCLNPTKERVDQLHAEYCSSLIELFETHKKAFGIDESVHLELY
uniref:diacylglycerol O-acyltransferase n=1 Tax=Syphacia muris TaxID=451379 RepID=A0A0N5AG68_9BILA